MMNNYNNYNYSNYGRNTTYFGDPGLYPTPDEKKSIRKVFSNTAWALIANEALIMVFYYAISIFLYAAGFQTYYDAEGALIQSAPVIFLSCTSVTFAMICSTLIFGSAFHFKVADLFDTEQVTAKKLLLTSLVALGAANAVYVINVFISMGTYAIGYELDYSVTDPVTAADWAAEIITSVVLAPVFEEIFYRGIIMRSLSRVSKRFAVFASSVIFGLIHGNIYQFLLGFLVGIVFAYADMKMNSILPSMLAHFALNSHLYIYYAFSGKYEDLAYFICVGIFIIIGAAALLYVLKHFGIEFPEYTERHKKRCLPVLICSVPAWIFVIYGVYNVFSSFTPIE
ncbi:MAG: lysostaphin resistance A-like protein [Oscillospiraceae bacterium]